LDFESHQVKQAIRILRGIDFDLAYLAVLTCEGLKPLSRWEKPLDDSQNELLQELGLLTKKIHRTVKTGRVVIETIFSLAPGYIQLYEQCFDNQPVDKTAQTQRFEGFLFGYPACCVEQYIIHPYKPNDLTDEDQRILFHWACRNCRITIELLPAYKRIYELVNGI